MQYLKQDEPNVIACKTLNKSVKGAVIYNKFNLKVILPASPISLYTFVKFYAKTITDWYKDEKTLHIKLKQNIASPKMVITSIYFGHDLPDFVC